MNIIHIDEQTGWRGGEQQASWLLHGSWKRGHTVHIAARAAQPFIQGEHGGAEVAIHEVPLRNELDLGSARKIAHIVKAHNIDILHAHTSHAHNIACIARWFAGRGKVVAHRRVSFPPKTNPFNRYKYKLPDQFVSVSQKVDDVLAEYGIAAAQRSVVYSAVDLERMNVAPIARSKIGVKDKVPLIVNAGALVGHKDQETLLRAIPMVLDDFPDLQVVIAGEGVLRSNLETTIHELQLQNTVQLLGHRNDVPALVQAADRYVSSSWSEGLGTSVLEALACETPVITGIAGGIPEMVLPDKTGYLVPSRDPQALAKAIIESLQRDDHARTMAKAGIQLVRDKFSVDTMVEGNLAVYEQLLKA